MRLVRKPYCVFAMIDLKPDSRPKRMDKPGHGLDMLMKYHGSGAQTKNESLREIYGDLSTAECARVFWAP